MKVHSGMQLCHQKQKLSWGCFHSSFIPITYWWLNQWKPPWVVCSAVGSLCVHLSLQGLTRAKVICRDRHKLACTKLYAAANWLICEDLRWCSALAQTPCWRADNHCIAWSHSRCKEIRRRDWDPPEGALVLRANQSRISWILDLRKAWVGSTSPSPPWPAELQNSRTSPQKQMLFVDKRLKADNSTCLILPFIFSARVPSREQMVHYSALTGG